MKKSKTKGKSTKLAKSSGTIIYKTKRASEIEGKGISEQITMFGTRQFPSLDEVLEEYSREFNTYIAPKGNTVFGFGCRLWLTWNCLI